MSGFRLHATLMVDESPADLARAYQREVGWAQGFRINIDTRLMLLGMQRLLDSALLSEANLRHCALVLGCRLGAMDSYEAFEDSRAKHQATPLAFAYALPSMPLAGVSVRYGIQGLTCTLTGGRDVGLRALRQGVGLLASGRTERVVIGCWDTPSQTAQGLAIQNRCRLLLAVLLLAGDGLPFATFTRRSFTSPPDADCVATLAANLRECDLPAGSGDQA